MENASKALLIAGAILIVILLIAVGMLVYSQAKGTIDTGVAQMNSTEIQMFNAQFEVYEGKQNLSGVENLFQTVISNNIVYENDRSKRVNVNGFYHRSDTGKSSGYKHVRYWETSISIPIEQIEKRINSSINAFTNYPGKKEFTVKIS